ncbi:MAG: phosphotransferase, partial [Pseudomonadota bacterium]
YLKAANMILAPDLMSCRAVVDWELSTLGNPLSDFAYFCRDYHLPVEAGGFGSDPGLLGIPAEAEMLAAYTDRTGQSIGDDWLYYVVFNMFRLAAIRQGVAKRIKDGTATSANAATAAQGAVDMANQAWGLVQRNF